MHLSDVRGMIGLVLAVAVGLVMVIGISAVAFSGRPLSDAGRETLLVLGGAVVGLIAGIVGGRVINGHH